MKAGFKLLLLLAASSLAFPGATETGDDSLLEVMGQELDRSFKVLSEAPITAAASASTG